jgi:dTDP-L-rhamnose 4-epimerase
MQHILITGGAGIIGSHLADELLRVGYRVRVLDNLSPQVHGTERRRPEYLSPDVELIVDDVRNPDAVRRALKGVDAVFHFVGMVGVGQSMYQIADYTSVNNMGTAVLLEALIERPVERLLVASSMSIYGEGLYMQRDGTVRMDVQRTLEQLKRDEWEPLSETGEPLVPLPTPEIKIPALSSIYALSKYDQERMCLIIGRAYNIPAVALRFFNVYGPNQALSNPYTGVLAIFASRLLEVPAAAGRAFNIGSGNQITIRDVAERMAQVLGTRIRPEIAGKYRAGDIRHCFPDISLAREVLGFEPQVALEDGLVELAAWLDGKVAVDRTDEARAELAARGLMV